MLIDGVPLTSHEARVVSAPTSFQIPGFGPRHHRAGRRSAALADDAARNRQRLESACPRWGTPASRRFAVPCATPRSAPPRRSGFASFWRPGSVGAEAADAELRALRAAQERLPEAPDLSTAVVDLDAVRAAAQTARERMAQVEGVLDAARRDLRSAETDLVGREAGATHRRDEAERLTREADEAEAARTMAALREDLAATELERAAREAVLDARRRALDAGDPETVERTVAAKRRARDEIERTLNALRGEIASLEGEMRVQGASALDEDIARLEDEIEAAERLRSRLALEAEASRLLHQTLLQAQREAHESWLAPIKAHVTPYLRLIHPDADIALDDATLELTGFAAAASTRISGACRRARASRWLWSRAWRLPTSSRRAVTPRP